MSETFFPINDLLRRKFQTVLTLTTLMLSVASTLFLLLYSERIGFGIASITKETLTYSLSVIFSQFLLFVGVLIFAVGAVITSFIVFLMMKQRTKDFGLIKAAGCPNSLVFGYFMTELLIVAFTGCAFGVVLGFVADFAVINVFHFQSYQNPPNLWFIPLVFGVFIFIAVLFGTKPIIDAAKLSPAKAMSPVHYFGMDKAKKFKPLSRIGITLRLSSRSLSRRQSASVRIVILLSLVFVLLTVSICGGIVAEDTTRSWVEGAVGKDVVGICHRDFCLHYKFLLSKFSGTIEISDFDYRDIRFAVPEDILESLDASPEIVSVDLRLVLEEIIREMSSYTIDPEEDRTLPVGGNRTGKSLIVGVNPEEVLTKSFMKGFFLNSSNSQEAVIGDTLAEALYSPDLSVDPPIRTSDPLLQKLIMCEKIFEIIGVSVEPINNGNVTYVPLKKLQDLTGISHVNIVLVKFAASVEHETALAELRVEIQNMNPEFTVFEVNEVLQENLGFLSSLWSTILILPSLILTSAAFCLIGYTLLTVAEQRQELAVLRAVGTKPKTITAIIGFQILIVLVSSCAIGIAFGVITTLMILIPEPVVTSITILEISGWLLTVLAGMFSLSLYPALKFAKSPLLKIMV